jgi:hypothetical protein
MREVWGGKSGEGTSDEGSVGKCGEETQQRMLLCAANAGNADTVTLSGNGDQRFAATSFES